MREMEASRNGGEGHIRMVIKSLISTGNLDRGDCERGGIVSVVKNRA
jgi:hypothetical protein